MAQQTLAKTVQWTLQFGNGTTEVVNFHMYPNCPRTVTNFASLSQEGGIDIFDEEGNKRNLSYVGVAFHRVIVGFMAQCGDIDNAVVDKPANKPGTGGRSIYVGEQPDGKFCDENDINKHNAGVISMANSGPNTNGSQVFICTHHKCSSLNEKHVAFGVVNSLADYAVIKKVEAIGSRSGVCSETVFIKSCKIVDYYTQEELEKERNTREFRGMGYEPLFTQDS